MRKPVFIITIILLIFSCTKITNKKPVTSVSDEKMSSQITTENISNQKTAEEIKREIEEKNQQTLEERQYFDNMSILEIIDLYIKEKKHITVGDYNQQKDIGYFEFLSHDKIQWHLDTSGFIFYPYLYINNNTNIYIEVFYYITSSGPRLGGNITTGKYYIYITKEDLINRYLGIIKFTDDFTVTKFFNTSNYQSENIKFKILTDTDVFINSSLHEERISNIKKNTEVEIIDMLHKNLNDDYPIAVRIRTDNLTGWINVNNIDFIKKEASGNINGIWLHKAVKNVISNYGIHAVSGKVVGDNIPIRKFSTNNSEQLHLLEEETTVFITEVSANIDVINGIETAWYKVYKYVEHYTENHVPDDYEINGWIFGANININEFFDDSYN